MTTKEFLNDKEKHKEVLLKASILGAFDQSVNYLMSEIRAMGKLEEEELAIIRYNINKFFKPDFNSK
jgi:F0F1-type ATP synthase alpha subunit